MSHGMKLGTALWVEGASERSALVAPLPSDSSRVVDLNRVERMRLAKLGEGCPETMADALVPGSLRQVLEGGARAIQRVRQALVYAEKWNRRGDLPETLAPPVQSIRLLPCLPRPLGLRRADGTLLERLMVQGEGGILGSLPQPSLAVVGMHQGIAGWCLALEDAVGAVLGSWMVLEPPEEGTIELRCGSQHRRLPLDTWVGLDIPVPRPGEVVLLPATKVRSLPGLVSDCEFRVAAPFDVLHLRLGKDIPHLTVQ